MVCLRDPLVQKVCELYEKISKLETLTPSKDVDILFTRLVATCIPPHPIDVANLCTKIKRIRNNLIILCSQAEGLLEKHYSTILGSYENPLDHLDIFPYYSNYLKLSRREFDLLGHHCSNPSRVAFVGSGPLPLTSIVLATRYLNSAVFHNYDVDASANSMAMKLVESHPDLSKRMEFRTTDIMNASGAALKNYDVVFLAALVGMETDEKMRVIEHLAKHMAPGRFSCSGAPMGLVLSVYHPSDDVINSVVVARKCPKLVHSVVDNGFGVPVMPCSKCGHEIQGFNPLSQMNMIEEFACQDHLALPDHCLMHP
ncbi:hypothetical protein Pfo_005158 [Paulownia fortunei]|nr:hypothetical protein Pfo_005158 [Paulownia fortunei]